MSRDRAVQLAPSTLALVLCRGEGNREEERGGCGDEERGRRIFKDFQAANVKCFWNRRLVRAVSEVTFQGWLESWVLLLEGHSAELEVLRDSWVRRALRPPRGFIIRALGDVSPVQMNPISQSHFIPLAEVLCCAISDMNTTQILVTQESLMEHLNKHYPGIATPSQDILYNALGTLIRERKIYHTGEGYFIVTPQTYFITRKPAMDCKYAASEKLSTSLPPITYLVSMESCADLTKGNIPSVSHCRSCSCFSEQSFHNILGQQSINESQVKTHRSIKEQKPLLRNQATSTSRDHYTCETNKQQVVLKEKEKCSKKFGISLFWRNVSKKEKSKKELVTFSAQFPPEEWPVRDEDNLDNIPRDVEHEIIKRINPVLTVDNLMKHTMLMQKAEEQKKYFSKGTSTDIIKNKHSYNFKGSSKKKNGKLSKYHKKVQSSKEKCKKDTGAPKAVPREEKDVNRLSLDQSDDDEVMAIDRQCYASAEIVQHDNIYKKQISNPFDGISYRENSNVNGFKSLKEIKRSRSGKQRRCVPRSRSLDCTERKAKDTHVEHINSERHIGAYNNEPYHEPFHSVLSDKDDLREYPPSYPQSSTLRIDDKYKPATEENSAGVLYSEDRTYICEDFQKKLFVHLEASVEHEVVKSHSTYKVTSMNSLKPNHCKSEINLNLIGRTHYRISEDSGALKVCNNPNSGLKDSDMPKHNTMAVSETGGFTKDNKALYQRTLENDDAHRYLYIEDDTEDKEEICPILDSHVQKANLDAVNWNELADENKSCSGNSQSQWHSKITFAPQFGSSMDNDQETYSPSLFSLDGSHECHKPTLHTGQQLPEYIHGHLDVEPETADCIVSSEHVDGSIFDYCNSSEANSVAETLHMSVGANDNEKRVANSGQQSGEMRTCFEHKLTLFHSKMNPSETSHHEKNENHSTTGDSGIESPRTRISIASNNSIVLETLKRRTFLQNLEMNGNPKHEGLLPTSSLMQITPAMNV